MSEDLVAKLKSIVGERGWLTDPERLEPNLTEWRGTWTGRTPIMVMPATTDEVASVVRACAGAGAAIVAQGGNTGLCGGAIPDESGTQVLLSLSRMKRIRSLSAEDFSVVAEAGCVLADLQSAAREVGRFFPLSLAAEGSCQIGGNLSTNAGGINVLKYGTARDQALGLEVVLPNGEVWDGLRTLRKDTAGYDVKQLFIGAEGTLGIITAASLKLYPQPRNLRTAVLAVADPQAAVGTFAALRESLAERLQAFELISERAMRMALAQLEMRSPFATPAPWCVLLEASSMSGERPLEEVLMAILEDGTVSDAVIAKNETEREDFWRVRHAISEAQKHDGASLKHDVSVPVGAVARFLDVAPAACLKVVPGARVVAFGHVGDGNIHFNVSQPRDMDATAFYAERERMAEAVYDIVVALGGSISAEHGVGLLKRDALLRYRSGVEIRLMRAVKEALDPGNLMNPGKVLRNPDDL